MTKTLTSTEIRNIIRAAAAARGCRYRITADDAVHFHGRMPNSTVVGWYLVGNSSAEVAARATDGHGL